MPFGRLHEEAAGDSKLLALSDAAWRMWGMGLIYCQKNLTDGFIPDHAVTSFGVRGVDVDLVVERVFAAVAVPVKLKASLELVLRGLGVSARSVASELCTPQVPGKDALWLRVEGGFKVHDYLEWNDSKEQIQQAREVGKARRQLYADVELLAAVKLRDGSVCRYCGREVNWRDKRGPAGATYDQIDPRGGNSLDNIVVACRGCNSSKGQRLPAECGMSVREIQTEGKYGIKSDSGLDCVGAHVPASGSGSGSDLLEKGESFGSGFVPASDRHLPPRRRTDGAQGSALPRYHLSHAACSPNFHWCVVEVVHAKLESRLAPRFGGDLVKAGKELRSWYQRVWASLPPDHVMDDDFRFWERRFAAEYATKDAPSAKPFEVQSNVPSSAETRRMYLDGGAKS